MLFCATYVHFKSVMCETHIENVCIKSHDVKTIPMRWSFYLWHAFFSSSKFSSRFLSCFSNLLHMV